MASRFRTYGWFIRPLGGRRAFITGALPRHHGTFVDAVTVPKPALWFVTSLREALESLEKDNAFLKKGDVFSDDFIKAYLDMRWEEVHEFEMTPHPLEFKLYYSV